LEKGDLLFEQAVFSRQDGVLKSGNRKRVGWVGWWMGGRCGANSGRGRRQYKNLRERGSEVRGRALGNGRGQGTSGAPTCDSSAASCSRSAELSSMSVEREWGRRAGEQKRQVPRGASHKRQIQRGGKHTCDPSAASCSRSAELSSISVDSVAVFLDLYLDEAFLFDSRRRALRISSGTTAGVPTGRTGRKAASPATLTTPFTFTPVKPTPFTFTPATFTPPTFTPAMVTPATFTLAMATPAVLVPREDVPLQAPRAAAAPSGPAKARVEGWVSGLRTCVCNGIAGKGLDRLEWHAALLDLQRGEEGDI
jgi:hypothetical protein